MINCGLFFIPFRMTGSPKYYERIIVLALVIFLFFVDFFFKNKYDYLIPDWLETCTFLIILLFFFISVLGRKRFFFFVKESNKKNTSVFFFDTQNNGVLKGLSFYTEKLAHFAYNGMCSFLPHKESKNRNNHVEVLLLNDHLKKKQIFI